MSVRVVARVRPLLNLELDKDVIVHTGSASSASSATTIRIPNPKNEAELYNYHFNSVYDQSSTQQDMFEKEVAPTVKHLFNGFDITLFAYGVTGTGKTHTMRGGKLLADRGVIPRLLSNIYRRCRKIEKDTAGATELEVSMSYYEIYNDRVYDLFQPPEKRTAAGLPIRDNNGKTVVCGLTERPCTTLKEFEQLYDEANVNRSTSATKLNAHSSRSHAILCVKLTQKTDTHTRISTASAIDLAGSEDNRRTDNNKDRLVESASINKSLFVLAQCVEAIGKKQARIPYRESKMTRILSLGQNNGLTVMILNLAPIRSYHLDTISSLNLASRTKKIEVNEIENEPIFRSTTTGNKTAAKILGPNVQRQPLRPLATINSHHPPPDTATTTTKPVKAFSVYSDKSRPARGAMSADQSRRPASQKRAADPCQLLPSRGAKTMRPSSQLQVSRAPALEQTMSKAYIEDLIEKRLEQKLAEKSVNEHSTSLPFASLPDDLQARLDRLEKKVEQHEDEKSQGLQYLLMAKQHHVRGEDSSALKMYQLAMPFFPKNEKLARKMIVLQEKVKMKRQTREEIPIDGVASRRRVDITEDATDPHIRARTTNNALQPAVTRKRSDDSDGEYEDSRAEFEDEDDIHGATPDKIHPFGSKASAARRRIAQRPPVQVFRDACAASYEQSPRTTQLLRIINTRDVSQIRLLKGVGAKRAEAIVSCLGETDDEPILGLEQLGALKGVGAKGVENMRVGLVL